MYLCVCIRQPNRKWKLNLRAVRRACNPSTGEPETGGPGDQGHYLATYGVWGLPKAFWLNKKKLHKKEKSTKICVLHKFTQPKYHFPCLKTRKKTLSHWQSWRRTYSLLVIARELEAGESEKMKRHFMSQGSKVDLNMEDSFSFFSNVWKYSGDWSLQWQAFNILIKTQAHINMNHFENT